MSKLAIQGGAPVRTAPYPDWPVFDERDVRAVSDVVRSGQWGGHPYPGPLTSMTAAAASTIAPILRIAIPSFFY